MLCVVICIFSLAPYLCVQLVDPAVTPTHILSTLPAMTVELLLMELEAVVISATIAFYLLRLDSTSKIIASLSALLCAHVFASLFLIAVRSEGALRWW